MKNQKTFFERASFIYIMFVIYLFGIACLIYGLISLWGLLQ
jgi:hypothetical protein